MAVRPPASLPVGMHELHVALIPFSIRLFVAHLCRCWKPSLSRRPAGAGNAAVGAPSSPRPRRPFAYRIARMNERDLDEFLNDPGDLFVRPVRGALARDVDDQQRRGTLHDASKNCRSDFPLELPGIYDKASAAERDGIQAILMTTWTAIMRPLEDFSEIPAGPHPEVIAEAAKRARELIDALGGLGALSADENVLVAPSLKLCANMAWQLPKPADIRQPILQ